MFSIVAASLQNTELCLCWRHKNYRLQRCSQDFTLGTTEAECRRRENRIAERCPLLQPTRGSGGASWAPPVELPQWGPGRRPSRQRIFGIFEAHGTLLVDRTAGPMSQQSHLFFFSATKSLNRRLCGHGPLAVDWVADRLSCKHRHLCLLFLSGNKRDRTENCKHNLQKQKGLNLRSITFFGNVTQSQKITALRNEITLKAPPGEWTVLPARPAFDLYSP